MEEGWRKALPPSQLSIEWIQAIQRLFLEGTGEEYFFGSVQALPVPDWDGNFMLFDSNKSNHETMRGVLWTSPFKDDIVRIVSFVLDQGARGKGAGQQADEDQKPVPGGITDLVIGMAVFKGDPGHAS